MKRVLWILACLMFLGSTSTASAASSIEAVLLADLNYRPGVVTYVLLVWANDDDQVANINFIPDARLRVLGTEQDFNDTLVTPRLIRWPNMELQPLGVPYMFVVYLKYPVPGVYRQIVTIVPDSGLPLILVHVLDMSSLEEREITMAGICECLDALGKTYACACE